MNQSDAVALSTRFVVRQSKDFEIFPNERTRTDFWFAESLRATGWHSISKELGLTARESELLLLAIDDDDPARLAARMGIAIGTVRTHKNRIFRKLGVSNMLRAVCLVLSCREARREPRHSET